MSNKISGKTTICGIIGDPVEHSMSPVMHNAAFAQAGLDYVYIPFRVRPAEVDRAIKGMKALNIRGLNVTIPHKVAVIPLLDELDPLAERIGAVNTIVNNEGRLKGYNTDAAGFMRTLLEAGAEPKGKKVTVLGAGGASRAVSFALADRGASLAILNRKLELDWAEALADRICQAFKGAARAMELTPANLTATLKESDILVNTTSVGMTPNEDATLVTADQLRPGLTVFDIVYNPVKTRLIKEAEAVGAMTVSGLDMLVGQGALAFEMWTGVKAPVELMKGEALRLLKQHED